MTTVIKGDSNINLDFSTGGRITGDFTNATIANRAMFQTSTANGATSVSAIPNGTNTQADLFAFNAADPTNAGLGLFRASATEVTLRSAITGTGTYLPMTFYTGGSERMRVDTSGNVGIGTSSPGHKLQVNGAIVSTDGTTTARMVTSGGVGLVSTLTNHPLAFQTNDTERARIDSSGNLLVGKTASNYLTVGLQTEGQGKTLGVTTNGSGACFFGNRSSTGDFYTCFYNGVGIGAVLTTNGTSTTYATSSDYRLKHDIQPMTGALAKVAQLKPVTYKWNSDDSESQGFIAHELQEVVPDCVTGEKDAVDAEGNPQYQGIDTSFLVATLTAALQEAHGLIKDLQARVDALEAK